MFDTKTIPLVDNMIVVYIDALGRRDLYRRLPKTVDWLKQFTRENKKNLDGNA